MSILLGVVLLFALLCAAVAAAQAVAINRVAPAREWRGWLLGWWRFGEISQRAGTAAASQAGVYKRAVIACLAFVVLGLLLSGWTVNQRNEGVADTARLTDSHLRPVAPMPGAFSLES